MKFQSHHKKFLDHNNTTKNGSIIPQEISNNTTKKWFVNLSSAEIPTEDFLSLGPGFCLSPPNKAKNIVFEFIKDVENNNVRNFNVPPRERERVRSTVIPHLDNYISLIKTDIHTLLIAHLKKGRNVQWWVFWKPTITSFLRKLTKAP